MEGEAPFYSLLPSAKYPGYASEPAECHYYAGVSEFEESQ